MLKITPIPAFQDNYIWMIQNGNHVAIVDPGDAAPVVSVLQKENLTLDAILITHHHNDHIGGVQSLLKAYPTKIFAPANESFDFPHQPVHENDLIQLPNLRLNLSVLDIPGHTIGHIAYYGLNHLFCGDTLFGGGCGRLFEGTHEQLFNSLQKLAALPEETLVYCAHEYTEQNLRFAIQVDSENPALKNRIASTKKIRASNTPSLPSSIGLEKNTNPFLRCDNQMIASTLELQAPDTITVFKTLRNMRNNF
ncbi:MAG: Hydroxyacylglutathione hydrolase [Pseudomonadota bacterium]